MTSTIVCGIDTTDSGRQAVHFAVATAKHLGARLHLVHAVDAPDFEDDNLEPAMKPAMDALRKRVEERRAGEQAKLDELALEAATSVETKVTAHVGRAWEVLLSVANDDDASHVVVGPHASSGSTLSKIETGQMSPTYEAVKKLAQGLEISVPQLFTAPQAGQGAGRMSVTRMGQGGAHPTGTYEHELLAESLSGKQMLPYRARVRARTMAEFDGWVRHAGEEFLYVLTGVAMLYTELYEPVELRRGDSAYYDAAMGHNLISLSEEDATVLWVTSLV